MTADREPYRSAAYVAGWLGVTDATVREWARTRVIRGYQPGGRAWLFLASEVAVDIARSQPQAPEAAPEPEERTPVRIVAGERITSIRALIREGRL